MADNNSNRKGGYFFQLSPFPLYINTLHCTVLALLSRYFLTLLLQYIFILILYILFSKRIRPVKLKTLFSLIPILFFFISVNSFRGGGEIIFEIWHFNVIKQGIYRGLYFSGVVVLLYLMSRLLVIMFDENEIVSSVIFFRNRKKGCKYGGVRLLLIIMYVIKILKFAYEEMKVFFKKNEGPVKKRFLEFFVNVFFRAESEYKHLEDICFVSIKSRIGDPVLILVQVAITISVMKLRLWGV